MIFKRSVHGQLLTSAKASEALKRVESFEENEPGCPDANDLSISDKEYLSFVKSHNYEDTNFNYMDDVTDIRKWFNNLPNEENGPDSFAEDWVDEQLSGFNNPPKDVNRFLSLLISGTPIEVISEMMGLHSRPKKKSISKEFSVSDEEILDEYKQEKGKIRLVAEHFRVPDRIISNKIQSILSVDSNRKAKRKMGFK